MRKTNWKVMVLVWAPSFFVVSWLTGFGGAIGAGVNAALAYVPVYFIIKIFNLDMNVYYDHNKKRITKENYDKLDKKVDYGFSWWPKRTN